MELNALGGNVNALRGHWRKGSIKVGLDGEVPLPDLGTILLQRLELIAGIVFIVSEDVEMLLVCDVKYLRALLEHQVNVVSCLLALADHQDFEVDSPQSAAWR